MGLQQTIERSAVKMRQRVEREIARAVVKALLDAGFALSLDNGGDDYELAHVTDADKILKLMFATDSEHLYAEKDGKICGWVFFVYGNDGWDVINDYSVKLEPYIGKDTPVEAVIQKYED